MSVETLIAHRARVDHSEQLAPGWFVGIPLEFFRKVKVGRAWNSRTPNSSESGAASIGNWLFLLMGFIAVGIFSKIFSLEKAQFIFQFYFITNAYAL